MPRKKKEAPNHAGDLYEIKITTGKDMTTGKLMRKSFYSKISKDDAKRQADEYKKQKAVAEQTGMIFVSKNMMFSEWVKKWLEVYKKPYVKPQTYNKTYLFYADQYIIPHFLKASLNDIRPVDVQNFFTKMSTMYCESTLKKIKMCLVSIFDTAIENDLCYKNPAKRVNIISKVPDIRKSTYNKDEVDDIINFACNHKYGLCVMLMLLLGLRRGEVVGLRWSDVDFIHKTITIQRTTLKIGGKLIVDTPKTETSVRTLPVEDIIIWKMLQEYTKPDDFIIGLQNGEPMSPDNMVRNRYNRFMNSLIKVKSDMPKLSPHELRHTCGTLLYKRTGNIYAVSKFLGHADILITTKIYVHNDVNTLKKDLKIV